MHQCVCFHCGKVMKKKPVKKRVEKVKRITKILLGTLGIGVCTTIQGYLAIFQTNNEYLLPLVGFVSIAQGAFTIWIGAWMIENENGEKSKIKALEEKIELLEKELRGVK